MIDSLCENIARQRWISKKLRLALINLLNGDFLIDHEFEADFFGYRYRGNTRNLIDRKVLFSGCHECDLLNFLRDYLSSLDEPVSADIGANVGHHALFLSRYSSRVYAFEPYAPVRNSMMLKLEANGIGNVEVFAEALGAADETRQFFAPPAENLGTGSFVEEFSVANSSAETLHIRHTDGFFQEQDVTRLDLIKLDVEGFERSVLEGAQQLLSSLRPVVIFESSLRLNNALHSLQEMRSVFPERYRYYRFTHTGKRRKGRYKLVELTQALMDQRSELTIVAVPEERNVPMLAGHGIFTS